MADEIKSVSIWKSPLLRQCFVTLSVALNMMSNGCFAGFVAIFLPSIREPGILHATPEEESWIASVAGFSNIIGNIFITLTLDSLGRKKSHILTILPMLAGWIIVLLATNITQIIAARFIQGLSMGILAPIAAVIIGETSEPRNRGILFTIIALSMTSGIALCQGVGTFMSWQNTALFCFIIAFVSLVLVLFTPETPSWLLSKGRVDECRKVFRWLRGTQPRQEEELKKMIEGQLCLQKANPEEDLSVFQRVKKSFRYLRVTYKKPEFYKPILIMFHLNACQQCCGLGVMISYTADLISSIAGPDVNVYYWMSAFNIERFLANVAALFLMKKMKRRSLLWFTASLCLLSFLGQGVFVLFKENNPNINGIWAALVLLGVYMFSIGAGFLALPIAISGEIFPMEYRGLGGGFSVMVGSISFFAGVKFYPGLVMKLGLPFTHLLYGTGAVYCMVVVWFLLPETKDKTLQAIEDEFRGKRDVKEEDKRAMEPLKNDIEANDIIHTKS